MIIIQDTINVGQINKLLSVVTGVDKDLLLHIPERDVGDGT
jgi:hypothetical protein